MDKLQKEIFDENNSLWYTIAEDGMYYPNIELPVEEDIWVGKYGLLRETYLREHKNSLYMSLYLSGELNKHLLEINEQAQAQVDQMVAHWAKA
ncbi:MAG: TnpV protein [Filifactoraceae bacterium]